MKSGWPTVLALALAAVISVMLLRARAEQAEAEVLAWHARADSALADADAARKRAEKGEQLAAKMKDAADSLAAAAINRVDTLRQTIQVVRAVPVPAECDSIVAVRDSLLDHAVSAAITWERAYNRQMSANLMLRSVVTQLRTVADSLGAILVTRPKPRKWYSPRLAGGPQLGIGTDGRAYAGFGVTIGVGLPW